MPIIRTPEERFNDLPNFPYTPRYFMHKGARIHYIDEGKGPTILCLHGEPSWSFLYRKMIPILSQNHRVVCFDFIGFGRSDKFTEQKEYSYDMHYNTLKAVVEHLRLHDITLVVQDWGGLLGLPFALKHGNLFSKLVIMNTFLPSAKASSIFTTFFKAMPFFAWRKYAKNHPNLPIGKIIQRATVSKLSTEVVAAYDAPFPNKRYKAGAEVWPSLVPIFFNNPAASHMKQARKALKNWHKPALVMFSDKDPITGKFASFFRKRIPSATKQPTITIRQAGHFLQEDKGVEIAQHIVNFMQQTS